MFGISISNPDAPAAAPITTPATTENYSNKLYGCFRVVAGILEYNAPIIAYASSDSFWKVANINYQSSPAWGYLEVFISRSGTKTPNLLYIGISSSSNNDATVINASQVLTGFITTNIVYKDDNYLYLRIPAYCRAIIKGTLLRGSVEATLATDVTEDDLTLVL